MSKVKSKAGGSVGRKVAYPSTSDSTLNSAATRDTLAKRIVSGTDDVAEEGMSGKTFRFLDLPSELRLRIYEIVLTLDNPIDLDPANYRRILPRLALFLVNHQVHEEAYRVFYSQTLRLFPTHYRFLNTKKPLLQRLPPRYRNVVTSLELRLGPGWNAPPPGQKITSELGLADCTSLRFLRIFVELDPSEPFFAGFRGKNATEETYKDFCLGLLDGIFEAVPNFKAIELDARLAVKKNSPLIVALKRHSLQNGKKITWGSSRDWTLDGDNTAPGFSGLEKLIASMELSDNPRLVDVQA